MKRVLAISLLGGFLAGNTAFAQVNTAKTISVVLQELGLSSAAIAELSGSDVAVVVEALVGQFGISAEQVISRFAENGSDGDFLAAVDALVSLLPQNTASIVQAVISARPEFTTEVVQTLVAGSGSAAEAKVIVDAAIQASIANDGESGFVVNDIVTAAIHGAADQVGSERDGERVIINDDGGDIFVEEVAIAIAQSVSGALNVGPDAASQIAVDGISEAVYLLTFVDESNTTIADIIFVATENRPAIASELVAAVSANQPSSILQQAAVAAATALEGSPLGQQQQADILAQISEVPGVDEVGPGTTSQTSLAGNTASDTEVEGTVGAAPSSSSTPAPPNTTASPPSGGGGGGGGDTITDQPPASAS